MRYINIKRLTRKILIIAGCFFAVSDSTAQQPDCVTRKKTYVNNISAKRLLTNYPDIDSILIKFEQDKPISLQLLFNHQLSGSREQVSSREESYNLEFEGDVYLFKNKYVKAGIPVIPKAEIDHMSKMQQCGSNYFLRATIHKDSIVYNFSQCCSPNKKQNIFVKEYKYSASYNGSTKQLEQELSKKYDKKSSRPLGDSVLIFTSLVNKDLLNNLQNIKLVTGTKSPFSDFIQKALEESGKFWIPMFQGGRPVKSFVRIYVRLNKDESITVSYSR